MSRDYRHGQKSPKPSRRKQVETLDVRSVKLPTKRQLEDTLRHAVTHQDGDAFEDYDEAGS